LQFKIEVDGGVAHDTVAQVVKAGAELLVAVTRCLAPVSRSGMLVLLAAARAAAGE